MRRHWFRPLLSLSLVVGLVVVALSSLPQTQAAEVLQKSATSHVGQWTNGENAYKSDGVFATCSILSSLRHNWSNFGFSFSDYDKILSVAMSVETKTKFSDYDLTLGLMTPTTDLVSRTIKSVPTTIQFYRFDITSDIEWLPSMFSNIIFGVRAKDMVGLARDTCYIDWVGVEVTYDLGISAGPASEEWVPINLPNIPYHVRRVLEWIRERILEHRTLFGLGLLIAFAGVLVKYEGKVRKYEAKVKKNTRSW